MVIVHQRVAFRAEAEPGTGIIRDVPETAGGMHEISEL